MRINGIWLVYGWKYGDQDKLQDTCFLQLESDVILSDQLKNFNEQ